jgi:hypothetical protein
MYVSIDLMTQWDEKAVTLLTHTHEVIGSNIAGDTKDIA